MGLYIEKLSARALRLINLFTKLGQRRNKNKMAFRQTWFVGRRTIVRFIRVCFWFSLSSGLSYGQNGHEIRTNQKTDKPKKRTNYKNGQTLKTDIIFYELYEKKGTK